MIGKLLQYYVNNGKSGQWYKFTCGMAMIAAGCPPLHIAHEGFLGSLENLLGARDIQFESGDFNKRYRITCSDQKFAFSLIDGQMMEWLMAAGSFSNIEIVIRDLDFDEISAARNDWQFYRDRRPDSYTRTGAP